MKKLRFLGLMLAMLVASVSFVGCSDDDDDVVDDPKSIVGTWEEVDIDITFQFNADGTGMLKDKSGTSNFKYTYSYSDEILKLWYVNSTTVYNYSAQRTGNTLMLTRDGSVYVCTKVK